MTERFDSGRSLQRATDAIDRDTDPSDPDVLARVAAGDLAALETLYDRYGSVAYAIALRITRDSGLARAAVQDAFLGARRNAGRHAGTRASVRTWLLAIVHHRAVDALRRRRAIAELPEGDEPLPASLILPDVWVEAAGRIEPERVRAALRHLAAVQREAIELAYWEGLTQPEIAARLGVRVSTIRTRLHDGLLALRRDLAGAGAPDGPAGATAPGRS